MPEEVKLESEDSHRESSICSPDNQLHRDRLHECETSRVESSSCSDESASCKVNGHETVEVIPTRTLKTSLPKPAANPLQFVKIGPCDLYRSAQIQLQKVGEVKKPKEEIKDEIEDWQSNLDNWKCSRRKQQEHIIERVVEVKKLEIEEYDRNRKRTKTFSEMMEERTSKGRKLSLPVYLDEDAEDLSDLGISSCKSAAKPSSPIPEENYVPEKGEKDEADTSSCRAASDNTTSGERIDETTYESAIQSYETRMKSLANGVCVSDGGKKAASKSSSLAGSGGRRVRAVPDGGRRASAAKTEERSLSSTDLAAAESSAKKPLAIPKVNIFARRELFERRISDEAIDGVVRPKGSDDAPRVRAIKARLSSLEKRVDDTNVAARPTDGLPLADVSVRDRLSTIDERMRRRTETETCAKATSPSAAAAPVHTRGSALPPSATLAAPPPPPPPPPPPLPCLAPPSHLLPLARSDDSSTFAADAAVAAPPTDRHGGVETTKRRLDDDDDGQPADEVSPAAVRRHAQLATGHVRAARSGEYCSSGRSSSSEDYENVQPAAHPHHHHHHQPVGHHLHHRSLDSLQGQDLANGFCFERVQSLECIDCCGHYPASVQSGDTDREDSGIHTADVSSSVSQADDFDLHVDSSIDVDGVGKATPAPAGVAASAAAAVVVTRTEPPPRQSSHINARFGDSSVEQAEEDADEYAAGECGAASNEPVRASIGTESREPFLAAARSERRPAMSDSFRASGEPADADRVRQNGDELPSRSVEGDDALSGPQVGDDLGAAPRRPTSAPVAAHVARSPDETCAVRILDQDEFGSRRAAGACDVGRTCSNRTLVESVRGPALEQRQNELVERNRNGRAWPEDVPDGLSPLRAPAVFAFEPSSAAVEPPKEKPPPPPPPTSDNSDDGEHHVVDSSSLRRMDSTRRIKKEIRQKRSSFLGIEGFDADGYLEPELESVKRPPDMTTFLQEERRLEKLLYRQSICSESDSTQGESRDSGVELDRNQADEHSWITEDTHSRQDSETYANTSTTSEEDEIVRKEREILEILELEECRNYEGDCKNDYNDIGERLVLKLKELERRKNTCWTRDEENRITEGNCSEALDCGECRPRPHPEPQTQSQNQSHSDADKLSQQKRLMTVGRSLQDVSGDTNAGPNGDRRRSAYTEQPTGRHCHRGSMPNIREEIGAARRRVPPPVPPNELAPASETNAANKPSNHPLQMSKQTLQALSAVPRSKIVPTDSWVVSKKKPRQEAYNYQHWLIQEAEHRRITEYQRRRSDENDANTLADHSDRTTPLAPPADAVAHPTHAHRSPRARPHTLPHRNANQTCARDNQSAKSHRRPLPDAVIQTLTRRVQNRLHVNDAHKPRRRENYSNCANLQEKMLSVSGKKKCSHCGEELGRGAAMIIESLRLFYHIDCFKCCVCCVQLGDGLMGTDVRVRNSKLHCHSCYSNDEGLKFSCV